MLNESFYNHYKTIEQIECLISIAAISGSIAEAAYGIAEDIKRKALSYLDEPLKDVLRRWKKYMRSDESWMK